MTAAIVLAITMGWIFGITRRESYEFRVFINTIIAIVLLGTGVIVAILGEP